MTYSNNMPKPEINESELIEFSPPAWHSFMGVKMLITLPDVLGQFVMWATRQSPYTCPDNLKEATEALKEALKPLFTDGLESLPMLWITPQNIKGMLQNTFQDIEPIMAWNSPKVGRQIEFLCVSTCSNIHPDNDFIDLDALAQNISNGIGIEYCHNYGKLTATVDK